MLKRKTTIILIILLSHLCTANVFADELVVYSARGKTLTRVPFNKYYRETGVKIKVVNGDIDVLLERIKKEGINSPADILLTVDAGSLWKATQSDLFQPVSSDILEKNIPLYLHDPNNNWFGLSRRARTIIYSTKRVNPSDLSTYKDLASPKWKNRLCLRTSKKVYNQSLVAMMIKQHGIEETEQIIKGWVQNLANSPYKKDNDVIRAIAEKKCDVGIVNHYYLARLLKGYPSVGLFWANQGDGEGGVYVDISGAGILRHSKNKESAVKFLEWLSTKKAQNLFADSNMEYPVNPDVKPNAKVQAWGDFEQNTENISHTGENREAAIELIKRANYL